MRNSVLRNRTVLFLIFSILTSPVYAQTEGVRPGGDLWSAMADAASTHPSVSAARMSAKAAGLDVTEAKWRRFPSLSVEGLLRGGRGDTVQAQAVVDQPLWTGGRISQNIRRASARRDAAIAGYDEAVQSISLDVVQFYYEATGWRARRAILADTLSRHRDMAASMERRVSHGISPVSDLELARARTLQIEQQVFSAQAQENSALQRLRMLVGRDAYDPDYTPDYTAEGDALCEKFDASTTVATSLAYDPRLRRLRFQAAETKADAEIARASALPQLSGQYSYDEIFGHRVGLVLRAQTDGGLSRFAAAEAAGLRRQSSEFQILAAERGLRDQVVADLEDYQSSCSRLVSGKAAADSAQRVTESYLRQFASGRRSWLDVMNAVRDAMTAEIDALDASTHRSAALSRIMLRTGVWQPGGERPQ
jgi:outer membrane protein, adhesin transport system